MRNNDGTLLALGAAATLAAGSLFTQRRGASNRKGAQVLKVTDTKGEQYNVRVVPTGGRYGRDMALTNKGAPMIEFYWPSDREGLGIDQPWGQFTGERYKVPTLLSQRVTTGLATQTLGSSFDGSTMREILVWATGGDPDSHWG